MCLFKEIDILDDELVVWLIDKPSIKMFEKNLEMIGKQVEIDWKYFWKSHNFYAL